MDLHSYLNERKIKLAFFAAAIGENERAVRNWRYRVRKPPLDAVAKIEAATAGAVTIADWVAPQSAAA